MSVQLRADREALEKLWQEGVVGKELLLKHSSLVDEFIIDCYEKVAADVEGDVSLVALGGYGRKELFPFSDIDLMILYRPEAEEKVGKVTDAVLYPLWDTGLEVGHGVRTVERSMIQAEEDYFFHVALLDGRLICGSEPLFGELMTAFNEKFVVGKREEFVVQMKEHRDRRRERYGSHSFLLEPHIKEGKGGMRDIQSMFWVAKVVFGLQGLDDFVDAGLMIAEEQEDFGESWDALVQLRNRLHYFSKRKNDQLFFELQEEVAEALGYKKKRGVLGVEQYMRDTYSHMENIAIVTDLFFDHVDEVLGLVGRGERVVSDREIERGIEIRRGRVHLTASNQQIAKKPQLLMRVFLASARSGAPVHHRTRKLISASLDKVTDKMRSSPRMSKVLISIMLGAEDVFSILEVMLEVGLLSAYIPEFSRIETLAQHDLYHIFTVDRHSLQAVAELRKVVERESAIYELVENKGVLFLAALFHDIGKGSGRDHSDKGSEMVVEIGRRMALSEEEIDCLSFLVKYHLYIPENGLRRDLNDVAFIQRCAESIGDVGRLSMLYLLSIADSKATGPSAWSDWKATLMHELYLKIRSSLEALAAGAGGTEQLGEQVEQGVEWLQGQIVDLLEGEEGILELNQLPDDYVLSFTPEHVSHHLRVHRDNYRLLRQKSLIGASGGKDAWSVLVMTTDRPGLLAKICGVLALHNLDVVKAQIFTWHDGTVVDVLQVRSTGGLNFGEMEWQDVNADLDRAIAHRLGLGHRLYKKMSSMIGGRAELVGKIEPAVIIDNESSDDFSVIEVHSADIPGALYHITQALADFGLNIHKAYIATEVERLIDIFYVQDGARNKIVDSDFQREIKLGLLHSLGVSDS